MGKKWELTLEKISANQINPKINNNILKRIKLKAESKTQFAFRARVGKLGEPEIIDDGGSKKYKYVVPLILSKEKIRSEEATQRQFLIIFKAVESFASNQQWRLTGCETELEEAEVDVVDRAPFQVPQLTPDVLKEYFEGIYERESHIRIIHDATKNFISTYNKHRENKNVEVCRNHILLEGRPAGCKTTLFERFKKWYEQADGQEHVLFVDAQTMSKAGLENFLLEKAETNTLPEIVLFEEIEKQDPQNLIPLISVMGSGYIAKLNARIGLRREVTPIVVWATCNNAKVIREFKDGALWSRFTKKLHCSRPSKVLMREILLRRIRNIGGNVAWADKILEFTYEILPKKVGFTNDDPREILGHLSGEDRLLDGSYQEDILKIIQSEKDEENMVDLTK